MADTEFLLSDGEVQRFIVDGYMTVQADFSTPLHDVICQKLDDVFEKEGNVGNNILPRVPEIQQVFDHPVLRGALTSLLGPDYIMNPHRHCHLNPAGSPGQTWHKDCYVFDHNIRQPRFHWVLALYYPQDVTEDMGPTGILPGRQYYDLVSHSHADRATEKALPLVGPAGTIALVNMDAWHRATPNTSAKNRYMLKFQFARLAEPQGPTWNSVSTAWTPPADNEDGAVSLDVWQWLCGEKVTATSPAGATASERKAQIQALHSDDEATRLKAAFSLAQLGADVVPDLLAALRVEARAAEDHLEDKTPANAHGTNPTALHAAQGLVAVGASAVPQLIETLQDDHWVVRASVADVLANLGTQAAAAAPALTERLEDEHWWVRRGAAEALGRMRSAEAAVPLIRRLDDDDRRVRRTAALAVAQVGRCVPGAIEALQRVLEDDDRYNRFYAGLALRRLDSAEARDALIDALFTARWCPMTSVESKY